MTMQSYALNPGRIEAFKGMILGHAMPVEVLGRGGRQVSMPKHMSRVYKARRWIPYGATTTSANTQNRFFQDTTLVDRGNVIIQAHQTAEGITQTPDSIVPQDVSVVMVQYSCLYGITDIAKDLYEDDIMDQMSIQIGERVTFVNEMICYGALKAGTNAYYGGTGTSRASVNGAISLGMLRKIARNLMNNHGSMVNRQLSASGDFDTAAIEAGFTVYCQTDMRSDIRDLVGFVPAVKYATGKAMDNEFGACEEFRFISSPDLPSYQDAGAAIGTTGLYSTLGVSIDVYTFIVTAKDAWSQIAVRGVSAIEPTLLMPGEKSKSDPHGQRGYAGAIWFKAVMLENQGWMAVGNVGVKTLS